MVDPTWGTRVTRLTADGLRHAYSRQQPWSADGTLLWLPYGNVIVDTQGRTVQAGLVSDHQWANTEPTSCYGGEGTSNVLKKVDCRTGSQIWRTVLAGYSACRSGDGEGRISDDDRYLALQCAGNVVLVVDLRAQAAIVARRTLSYDPNNVSMSQSGRFVLINGIGNGVHAWDWAAGTTRQLTSWGQHGDVCQDEAGDDWYVQSAPRLDAWRMRDGAARQLLTGDTVFGESHVSCTNIDRDGWVYLSQYTGAGGVGRDQVVALRLDGSGSSRCSPTPITRAICTSRCRRPRRAATGRRSGSPRNGAAPRTRSMWLGRERRAPILTARRASAGRAHPGAQPLPFRPWTTDPAAPLRRNERGARCRRRRWARDGSRRSARTRCRGANVLCRSRPAEFLADVRAATEGIEVGLLANNASFGGVGKFMALPLEMYDAMIAVNARAYVALTHAYLPQMLDADRGTLIFVSSSNAQAPIANSSSTRQRRRSTCSSAARCSGNSGNRRRRPRAAARPTPRLPGKGADTRRKLGNEAGKRGGGGTRSTRHLSFRIAGERNREIAAQGEALPLEQRIAAASQMLEDALIRGVEPSL